MSRKGEKGGLLVGLVASIAILAILSTVAMQNWADVLRRDNEAEMMFRAQDITRAIRKYQRDKPGQPLTELKMLMEPGSKRQYFLRKLYKDPLVKGGKWGLLYAAPQGGVYDPSTANPDGMPGGGPSTGLPGLQNPPGGTPQPGVGQPGLGGLTGPLGQKMGEGGIGLPIIGVKTLSKDRPFRVYKDSEDYGRWLFTVYDLDRQVQPNPGAPQPGDPQGVGSGALPPGNRPGTVGTPPPPPPPTKGD